MKQIPLLIVSEESTALYSLRVLTPRVDIEDMDVNMAMIMANMGTMVANNTSSIFGGSVPPNLVRECTLLMCKVSKFLG